MNSPVAGADLEGTLTFRSIRSFRRSIPPGGARGCLEHPEPTRPVVARTGAPSCQQSWRPSAGWLKPASETASGQGLSEPESSGKAVGRPRTRVTRDQVLALRSQGLSYRAAARRLHISPALAHRLAQDAATAGPSGRSETPPAHLETTSNPHACPAAFQGHHAPATGKRSNL